MRKLIESMYSHLWIAIRRTHSVYTGSEQLPVGIVLYCQVASIACQTPHTYLLYGVIFGRYYSSLERYSNIIWFHTIVCYLPYHSHPTSNTSHIHQQINSAGSEKKHKGSFPATPYGCIAHVNGRLFLKVSALVERIKYQKNTNVSETCPVLLIHRCYL